jgi:selenocysteine-specific translation elongation factor
VRFGGRCRISWFAGSRSRIGCGPARPRWKTASGRATSDGHLAVRHHRVGRRREVDVAYRYFATPRRKFIIADTPGHIQYTRNMVTGASTADLAVILIDEATNTTAGTLMITDAK